MAKETAGVTQTLADFYSTLDYEKLPPAAVDRAKYFCLDFLGVAVRGSTTPSARAVVTMLDRLNRRGDSVVMGTSRRTAPEYAALANGTAAHSLEMDDVSNDASLHPGAAVFPTAFACADLVGVGGRGFLASVVAGYDLMIRLGRALDPARHYARGFHPTGTCGTFGAAAGASRLLGLGGEATAAALGIAGSQAAGSMEFLAQGTWTKRLHPGWAAHSGLIAALLAREGFTGPTTILEGRDGFLHAYSDGADASRALEGLGRLFYITRCSIKLHACCRYKQGPIDCLLRIAREHDLAPQDVERVTVGLLQAGFNIIAAPREMKLNPRSVVDAQFSMPFGAAVALLYRRASLSEYAEDKLALPQVRELMAKVQCVQDPALEEHFPSRWPAWVEVHTRDGRKLRARVEYPKGDPATPLSWEELKEKFRYLTEPCLPPGRQEEVIRRVESLEAMRDVRELANLAAVDG